MNNKVIPVVAAIIQKDDKILITRKAPHKTNAGLWELPGGKVKDTETDETALIREIEEELGLSIVVQEWFFNNTHEYSFIHVELRSYICEYISGEIKLVDHDKAEWVTKDQLSDFTFSEADIPMIKKLINKK